MILEFISLFCLLSTFALLLALSWIDLKEHILPNELVLALAACGFVFHLTTTFQFVSLIDMGMGAAIGGGMLYTIRLVANYFYKDDTLGLGDVKLMLAGGIWLGSEMILMGITIGAFAGFFHGLGVAVYTVRHAKVPMDLSRMGIPAGPGFAVGLIGAAILKFWSYPLLFYTL
jgi:leader peptidase (prepilin peptidase)/N-methyltransferase